MRLIPDIGRKAILSLLSEPLVHFLFVAFILFYTLDSEEKKVLEVDSQALISYQEKYHRRFGEFPDAQHLEEFENNWLKEEALYLEGLKLGLDQHDDQVRQTVINKMVKLLQQAAIVVEPDEQELARYFDRNKADYTKEETFDFELVSPIEKVDFNYLDKLKQGYLPTNDYRKLINKTPAFIVAVESETVLLTLNTLAEKGVTSWVEVTELETPTFIRLTRFQPRNVIALEKVRSRVIADWKRHHRQQQINQQVTEILQQYREQGLEV